MIKKFIKYGVYTTTIIAGAFLTIIGISPQEKSEVVQGQDANLFIHKAHADYVSTWSPPSDDDGDDES